MRVATAAQIADLDRRATEEFGIAAAALMANAGRRVAEVVLTLLNEHRGRRVIVLAGKGNNGGDGLVTARHLHTAGVEVAVFLLGPEQEFKGEAGRALRTAREAGVAIRGLASTGPSAVEDVVTADVFVDALFGTGFSGPVRGDAAQLIAQVNQAGRPIVAVDIPSGLQADTGRCEGPCIHATATVTMGLPKVGLLVYPGAEVAGTIYVADIGYPPALMDDPSVPTHLVTSAMVRSLLPLRRPDSHKGTSGRVLIIAGSVGYTGAAVLATLGALRTGAGLVTVGVPRAIYPIVASQVTEGMPTPLPDADGALAEAALERIEGLAAASDVVAVGPGLSQAPAVSDVILGLLRGGRPLVIDADGLTGLAGKTQMLARARGPIAITPHPGELSRLMERSTKEIQEDRLAAARTAAARFHCVVVLKGARTIVASPDGEAFIIPTGNPGMATGGMGDVLTGAVASLIGQGMEPAAAAYAAAYVHGLAADLIANERGLIGMLASEVADRLPVAIQRVRSGDHTDVIKELRD